MFFGIYFTSILGFAFVFKMLIPEKDPFDNFGKAFIKVVAMMIGEVEYGDTFADESIVINFVFLFFVFIVPIIINNLLIGLTVSNVTELIINATVKSLESKIKTITQIEKTFLVTKLLGNFKSITRSGSQEVCIHPSDRKKSILSETDLTRVHKVDRDEKDNRIIGKPLKFLNFDTYIPVSIVEEAMKRIDIN